MKDYVQIDVFSLLGEEQVFRSAIRHLPEFKWRRGDSDALGPYLSGATDDSVHLKIWFGEDPRQMSVSFRRAWPDDPDRERKKEEVMRTITEAFIPSIGSVSKIDI